MLLIGTGNIWYLSQIKFSYFVMGFINKTACDNNFIDKKKQ